MREYWDRLVQFLSQNDLPTLVRSLRDVDWAETTRSPVFWMVTLLVLVVLVWRKLIRLIIFMASVWAFLMLLPYVIPPEEGAIPLRDLLVFVGGTLMLVVINLYVFFMRE